MEWGFKRRGSWRTGLLGQATPPDDPPSGRCALISPVTIPTSQKHDNREMMGGRMTRTRDVLVASVLGDVHNCNQLDPPRHPLTRPPPPLTMVHRLATSLETIYAPHCAYPRESNLLFHKKSFPFMHLPFLLRPLKARMCSVALRIVRYQSSARMKVSQ